MTEKRIVYKVEDGMVRDEILATTYQMRNFYNQFGDGFFSVLDVMNYIQHQQIVRWCRKGQRVLDVCCGRGLLLPLLRYERKDIASYTGVDIEPKNAIFLQKRVTDNKPIDDVDNYYPFRVDFVHSNVAEMSSKLLPRKFDVIVYTSSIEHMHKDAGEQSLIECKKVSEPGTTLIVTCPNTPEDQDGYDTQYAAHVYEWKRSELVEGITKAGFEIVTEWGILIDAKTLKKKLKRIGFLNVYEHISKYVPSHWLIPCFAPLFPGDSKEIAIMAVSK